MHCSSIYFNHNVIWQVIYRIRETSCSDDDYLIYNYQKSKLFITLDFFAFNIIFSEEDQADTKER